MRIRVTDSRLHWVLELALILVLAPVATSRGAGPSLVPSAAIYYFISDLHIGGDADLDRCDFEPELMAFLRDVAQGPAPAELIIVGDAFGLWEFTRIAPASKIPHLAATHPELFGQFRRTGEKVRITLLPGNHDYELACFEAQQKQLIAYNIHVEPVKHLVRPMAGRTIWIEHGNQRDGFNTFPDFGNPFGLPSGYFITTHTVSTAARAGQRGHSPWLGDLESVYPNEELPFWIWSNYFYREMTPLLRWLLLPFLVLFGLSAVVLAGRGLEKSRLLRTHVFHAKLGERFGLPGRLIDWVVWVNGVVITFLLVLAIPLYLLTADIRATLGRYGVAPEDRLRAEKEDSYLTAAKAVFVEDPSVVAFVYGHTHLPSLQAVDGRYIINTGTWLKRLERIPAHVRLLPDVYAPSYRLNYFTIRQQGDGIQIGYRVVPKSPPDDLTWLQRLVILGRHVPDPPPIPTETLVPRPRSKVPGGVHQVEQVR